MNGTAGWEAAALWFHAAAREMAAKSLKVPDKANRPPRWSVAAGVAVSRRPFHCVGG